MTSGTGTPTPGTRVRLLRPFGWHVAGIEGTVVDLATSLLNGHDCAVLWDDDHAHCCVSCMYWHEIAPVWVGAAAAEQETHE